MKPRLVHEAKSDSDIHQVMGTLLHAWQHEGSTSYGDWEPPELEWWERLIPIMQPVAPHNILKGAEFIANLKEIDWNQWLESGCVYINKGRVAFRRSEHEKIHKLGGWSWEIFVDEEQLNRSDELDSFLAKISSCTQKVSQGWLVRFENKVAPGALAALILRASQATDSDELVRTWDLAHVLGLREHFYKFLPKTLRYRLADILEQEIRRNFDSVTLKIDNALSIFSEGHDPELQRKPQLSSLPDSRFARLMESYNYLFRYLPIGEDYFANRVMDFCLLAEPYSVLNLLHELKPGRALFSGIDEVCYRRPQLLCNLAFHPAFTGTAVFSLTRLRMDVNLHPMSTLYLADEWYSVQLMARELLCRQYEGDTISLIAQGIRDLKQDVRSRLENVFLQHDFLWSEEVWQRGLEDETHRSRVFQHLSEHLLSDRVDEFAIIFALHILSWSKNDNNDSRKTLVCSVVQSYVSLLTPKERHRPSIKFLAAFPALLSEFWDDIAQDPSLRRKWLYPVSFKELSAKAEEEKTANDLLHMSHVYDSPGIVKEHLLVIAAQGNGAKTPEDITNAIWNQVEEAFELEWTGCPSSPFSWFNLSDRFDARPQGIRPLFQEIGQLFSKSQFPKKIAEKLVELKPEIQVLARLLGGAPKEGDFTTIIRDELHSQLGKFLQDDNTIRLGEALDAAAALLDADEPEYAKQSARLALEMLKDQPPGSVVRFRETAELYVATALYQQEKWLEVLQIDLKTANLEQNEFIRNLRAIAYIKTDELDSAEKELDEILRRNGSSEDGWINRCLVALLKKEFEEAIVLVKKAREALGSTVANKLVLMEASAINHDLNSLSIHPDTTKVIGTAQRERLRPPSADTPIDIFFSYAHEDETLVNEIQRQLVVHERNGEIKMWHDREIPAGAKWRDFIDDRIERAHVILLFMSPSFLGSSYCFEIEGKIALRRDEEGTATVIPVVLRACDWEDTPFGEFQGLPKDGEPFVGCINKDQASLDIAQGIMNGIKTLKGETEWRELREKNLNRSEEIGGREIEGG